MALYELQWEMNAGFGAFFAQTTSAELRRCLEHSPFFLRDANDQFILDIHLDQLDLDLDDIRRSCFEILSSAREIVGCEDLLERLEAEGKSCEELSPDILASVLREDDAFEKVGRNRFRSKTCKR